ncbi:MAG: hypothetical protein EOP21_00670 [Hyphomicrobiales bacterium]|nr:MAG: hypothetical protein EOP21_00670 [Hyphomicrobiales bacterium]
MKRFQRPGQIVALIAMTIAILSAIHSFLTLEGALLTLFFHALGISALSVLVIWALARFLR